MWITRDELEVRERERRKEKMGFTTEEKNEARSGVIFPHKKRRDLLKDCKKIKMKSAIGLFSGPNFV